MKSLAFLKDSPLAFTLRILALIVILSIVGINLTLIQGQVQNLKRGYIPIGFQDHESKHYAVVVWLSSEAQASGISGGDIILNPQARFDLEVGVPVTFFVKSENAPVREVTLIPESPNDPGFFLTMLGLSPRTVLYLQVFFLLASLVFTGLFSIVAFWHRMDAWLAFLVVVAFSHLCGLLSNGTPQYDFFKLFIPSAIIFFLIVFPTGKLAPGWSWLLVFLPLPNNINPVLFKLGILEQNYYTYFPADIFGSYSTTALLIILWVIFYEYRDKFTLFKQRWVNWLTLGLIVINFPSLLSFLRFLGLQGTIVSNLDLANLLRSGPFAFSIYRIFRELGIISIVVVLAVVVYRYRHIFTPLERQQMKWLVFGLSWSAALFTVSYTFYLYYASSGRYDNAAALSSTFDKFLLLTVEVIVLSVVISLFRYGLYDIDTLLNRALVYSGLMIVIGAVCLSSTMLVDSVFEKSDSQNNVRALATSMVLIAVTFNPARRWLQKFVSERFQSEEPDFAEAFYEFTPEMRTFFSMAELSKILAEKSVDQFGVTYASVYIKNKDGKLQHLKTEPTQKKRAAPLIEPEVLAKLEEDEPVLPGVDSKYSLILPLALSHGRRSELIGALVLGQRLDGLGYSVEMIKKMKSFAQEVGKALYTAQIRDRSYASHAGKSVSKRAFQNK